MKFFILNVSLICFLFLFFNTNAQNSDLRYQPKPYVQLKHAEWTKNATIYEVNIRQYTPEGTFKAFEKDLPRLKNMGIDIIWLMPIHPIGEKNRKGGLGSYYSVKDFRAINPEFGTETDFRNLVKKIHSLGMHVIIDWVGNHSAWDNNLTKTHPDWYTKTRAGNFQPTPWYDWDDVIDFDYDNPDLRKYMTESLKYWVKDFDIDGYRCDVAGFIPLDFWDNARKELDAVKPVFMLCEWESRDMLKNAFDMCYSWTLWNNLKNATNGKPLGGLVEYLSHDVNSYPRDGYRMVYTENHDTNSWEGTAKTNFKDGLETAMVFCGTVNGMPMVYSGQEAGSDKSLKFFDKDPLVWKDHKFYGMYRKLFDLKHKNQALWNGNWGGEMIRVVNDKQDRVISFYREKNSDAVMAIFNFSGESTTVTFDTTYFGGNYNELFTNENLALKNKVTLTLKPWDYKVLVKK